MLFSIAIPVYGQQQFITTALESIQAQSADYEMSVMDATPDTSVQLILNQYQDIISYRRHGKDDGQSAAIQEGWDNTSGDIVAWLCADDYYFPNTLQLVQEVFEKHQEVDVVYGDSVFVDENNHFKMYFPAIESDVSCLPVHDCISQPACFVRRRALQDIGGLNLSLHYVMDWDLWVRLFKNGAIFHYLHKPLALSRIYPGTKTGSMSLSRYKEINTQLKMQPSHLRRILGLIGTFYYDLSENRQHIVMHALYVLLDMCRKMKQQRFPSTLRLLYGLDPWLNYFNDSCEIYLACYGGEGFKKVLLHLDKPVVVSLTCNDISLQLFEHKGVSEYIFLLPEQLNSEIYLRFKITCNSMRRCQLSSFVLQ